MSTRGYSTEPPHLSGVLRLSTVVDLRRAATLVSWLNRPSPREVLVSLPWLDTRAQARAAKALRHHFNDCGCLWGAQAFLAALGATLVGQHRDGGWSAAGLGVSLGVAFVVAVTAKFLGLAWSRWRLTVWLRRIAPPSGVAADGLSRGGVR